MLIDHHDVFPFSDETKKNYRGFFLLRLFPTARIPDTFKKGLVFHFKDREEMHKLSVMSSSRADNKVMNFWGRE
jgi:hypothetical protein